MNTNTLQNSKKNVAAIVAVSLVFGIMIGLGIQTTDAQLAPPQFGDRDVRSSNLQKQQVMDIEETDVIGEIDRNDPAAPSLTYASIERYRAATNMETITYKITYGITAGNQDLKDIQIRVTTDSGVWNYEISSLDAFATNKNVARVKALDPDSITGEFIGYTTTGVAKMLKPPN